MPLVTNVSFSKAKAHQFLSDLEAQKKALDALLNLLDQYHFIGAQFDFEMIALDDRDKLSQFYKLAADTLHQKKYLVSFAVSPTVTDDVTLSSFTKKVYENWEGAYDFKAIGAAGDFISIMAYNQHGVATTPGPTASYTWTEAAVKYALKFVPAKKISLGLPDYSTHWYTGANKETGKITVMSSAMSYSDAERLLKSFHAHTLWDKQEKINYAMFERFWLNEYMFFEDAKSFAAKYSLVKKYHLRGVSVFDLGTEDERVWSTLPLLIK